LKENKFMRWSVLFLIILISIIFLSAYLLLNLNTDIVLFDFLFNEIQTSLGILLLSFFLLGSLVSLGLEVIYFSRKNKE
tara:strand:- start:3678 stop:3914 length:237 start_codon:yes stop_codon:yes gene_type:complete